MRNLKHIDKTRDSTPTTTLPTTLAGDRPDDERNAEVNSANRELNTCPRTHQQPQACCGMFGIAAHFQNPDVDEHPGNTSTHTLSKSRISTPITLIDASDCEGNCGWGRSVCFAAVPSTFGRPRRPRQPPAKQELPQAQGKQTCLDH